MQSLLCALFQKSSWDREPILPAGGQRPLRLAIPPLMKTEQASGRGQFIVVTGVNSYGHNTGVYDLGSLGSTHCPGPQCQAISFVLRTGVFSSFEDPVAAPQTTFAFSINAWIRLADPSPISSATHTSSCGTGTASGPWGPGKLSLRKSIHSRRGSVPQGHHCAVI